MSTFLVTGATGTTGAPTVHNLLDAGHRVKAVVHRVDTRSDALAAVGAEIVVGDLLDFNAVSAAMTGVDAAYFCYPIAPGRIAGCHHDLRTSCQRGRREGRGQHVANLGTSRCEK